MNRLKMQSSNNSLLAKMLEQILYTLNNAHISHWLENKTLLGYESHRGVLTSNSNHLGMYSKDKQWLHMNIHKNLDMKVSDDHECLNRVVIKWTNIPELITNISLYDENDCVPPVKANSLFLGQQVYVPYNYVDYLTLQYGHQKYDINDHITKDVKIIPHINSVDELIKLTQQVTEPIIIKNTGNVLNCAEATFENMLQLQKTDVFGYHNIDFEYNEGLSGIWEQFKTRQLKENILDSIIDIQCKDLLEQQWDRNLYYVLTISPKTSKWHIDPPEFGGGGMKLLHGCKLWWFVTVEDLNHVQSMGIQVSNFENKSITELIELSNQYLKGKIQCCIMEAGNVVYFPKGTLHKVMTISDSYGFGLYL